MNSLDTFRLQCYTASVCTILAKLSCFTNYMSCINCQGKHKFDNYPISFDTKYYRNHHIQLYLLSNHIHKQMNAVEDYHDTYDISSDANTSSVEQDFQEG